jgi:hypothetical protein
MRTSAREYIKINENATYGSTVSNTLFKFLTVVNCSTHKDVTARTLVVIAYYFIANEALNMILALVLIA